MKSPLAFLSSLAACAGTFALLVVAPVLFAANPNLANIKSIYVLPMTNGMDQYLANRLQSDQVLTVTTDPQAADAVLTDSIGPAFEHQLADLYPPPEPDKPVKKEDAKEGEAKDAVEEEPKDLIRGVGGNFRFSSFRKGRGVIFLVDRRSKQVVWSTHERPKDTSARELDRTAARVSVKLKRDSGVNVK